MKIGVFSNFYPPSERGGAELVAQRVADELSVRGHRVFVLSTMPFSGLRSLRPRALEYHIERVYRFFPLNFYHVSNAHRYPFPVRLFWHGLDLLGPFPHTLVDRLIAQEEPDVILTHNLKGLGVRSAHCVQEAGVRHIHTLHDVQLSVPSGLLIYGQEGGWFNQGPARRLYEKLAMRSIGTPDVVISPSRYLADFYQQRGFFPHTPFEIIPNPVPKRLNKPVIVTSLSGPARFLFVGQLEPHKGVLLLLRAIEQLDIPFELHIAGDGSLAPFVSRRAERDPRIFFHGFISLEHIGKILTRADAVVLPSLCYENSPTVLYEAFQAGVPVIASRIGGISERVREGENGLFIEPGSVDSLVFGLKRFAQERKQFASLRRAIAQESEQFSLKKYVDRLEGLFR